MSTKQAIKFTQFPNGCVWPMTEQGCVEGTVRIPGYKSYTDNESLLDAISEAVTDSSCGLTGFSHQYLGSDYVAFQGTVVLEDMALTDLPTLSGDELVRALMDQYGLQDFEAQHAVENLDTTYDNECVLGIQNSPRQIRTPAHPEECSYVRVVLDGYELAYWTAEEWAQDAAVVMGAIIGAAKG